MDLPLLIVTTGLLQLLPQAAMRTSLHHVKLVHVAMPGCAALHPSPRQSGCRSVDTNGKIKGLPIFSAAPDAILSKVWRELRRAARANPLRLPAEVLARRCPRLMPVGGIRGKSYKDLSDVDSSSDQASSCPISEAKQECGNAENPADCEPIDEQL